MSDEPFGARLRRLREAAGLTQQQLAEAIDSWQPSVAAWEAGRHRPSLENLLLLAGALGVSLDELAR